MTTHVTEATHQTDAAQTPAPEALATWQRPLSVAPMMQRTDRHDRYMMRCLSRHTLLYTEMVTTRAILHGDRDHLLGFDPAERPLVLQIGGDDPEENAQAARIAQDYGYDEVNLNVGCPSERVQSGNFGACLMREPQLVRDCVLAMSQACDLPITVKHRIGVDELDTYEDMLRFVQTVAQTGRCRRFTVHARKAWLKGLSPKENRDIPPLRYAEVYALKREHPELTIEINGGVLTLDDALEHLSHVDAVMIGRAAYDDPYQFARADSLIFKDLSQPPPTRHQVVERMLDYIERELSRGAKLHQITRHMVNLFIGQRGAKRWRRALSERHHLPGAGPEVVLQALALIPQEDEALGYERHSS